LILTPSNKKDYLNIEKEEKKNVKSYIKRYSTFSVVYALSRDLEVFVKKDNISMFISDMNNTFQMLENHVENFIG